MASAWCVGPVGLSWLSAAQSAAVLIFSSCGKQIRTRTALARRLLPVVDQSGDVLVTSNRSAARLMPTGGLGCPLY